MKKKLLITAVAATVALSSMGALAACGDDSAQNAEIAQKAIATVRNLYADKAQETPIDYPVIGQTNVDGVFYPINWSVTSDVADYGNYVVVGGAGEIVTIHITQTSVAVEYKLIASVTVGESTETAEFSRKIPAKAEEHAGTLEDPFLVANVKEIGAGLGNRKYYLDENGNPKQVYVKGYVVDPGTPYSGGGRINNAYIVDEYAADKNKDSEGALNVYTLSYDSTVFTGQYPLRHGDLVVLVGFIENFDGTIEITYSGSNVVNCVSLTAAPDNRTPEEKAQAAVDAVTLATSKFTAAGDVTLPASSVAGVTLTWAEKEDSEYVSIANNVLTISENLPETEASILLTVSATIDGVTKTKDITIKVQTEEDLGLEHAGTAADPYNLSDVKKRFAKLAENTSYKVNGVDQEVYVEGYVTVGGTVGTKRLENVYLADVAGTAQADSVLVYGIDWDSEKLPEGTTLTVGDKIVLKGYLKDYNGTKEIAQTGSGTSAIYPTIVTLTPAQDDRTPQQKIDAAKAELTLEDSYAVSGDVTLPKTSVRGVTVTWTSNHALITIAEDGSKMTVGEIPEGSSTPVIVTATLTCGEGADAVTDTKTFPITLSKQLVLEGEGTSANPYTVADVRKILNTLASGAYWNNGGATAVKVYFSGFVTDAGSTLNNGKGYYKPYVGATATATQAESVLVYNLYWDETVWTKPTTLRVGDEVVVCGYLTNYSGTKQVSYSGSDYPTLSFRNAAPVPDSEKVSSAKTALKLGKVGDVKYTQAGETISFTAVDDVTVTYESSNTDLVTVAANGTVTIVSLPPTGTATVTITAEITAGAATDTKPFTLTLAAAPETPVAVGTFKLKLQQVSLNKVLYFKGTINNSNFGETTEDVAQAADVVVAAVTGGHTLKVGNKYLELNASNRMTLVDASTRPWVYDYDLGVFTWTGIAGKVYYLGTYGTYNTISASETSYISGDNAANVGVSQFVAQFVDLANRTDAQKVADALEKVKAQLDNITSNGNTPLPTSTEADVSFSWAFASDNEATCATLTNNDTTLTVSELPDANATVKLVVTATCGDASDTKNVSVVVESSLPAGAETKTLNINTHATTNSWAGGGNKQIAQTTETLAIDSNVSATFDTAGSSYGNTAKYYVYNDVGELRMYTSNSSKMILTAATGYKIYSVVITYRSTNNGYFYIGATDNAESKYDTGASLIVNATSVSFTTAGQNGNSKGQANIQEIKVVYVPA